MNQDYLIRDLEDFRRGKLNFSEIIYKIEEHIINSLGLSIYRLKAIDDLVKDNERLIAELRNKE